ncbi:zf-HC2 domain-containing protein [Nonomuraea sp. NPDC000554]|uniref:anti-sigma factor family protein n=1 Tax=Nonomuraea sp. NPDC000554 TaxID=3154259 RepID=UPI00332C1DD9
MTCEEVRLALGAHALGALDPDEALEIDTHLATCEACGAELEDLAGVAGFLGKVSERDVELVASPPRQVLDRLLNARAKRHRRGRIFLAAAASAAVLAVGGTVWTAVGNSGGSSLTSSAAAPKAATQQDPQQNEAKPDMLAQDSGPENKLKFGEPTPLPSARPSPPGREFTGENAARRYGATVTAFPGGDLSVRVSGVPIGTRCKLVVVAKAGERDVTEGWTVSRATYQDNAVFPRHTRIPMADIARFEVVGQDGKALVKINVSGRK